MKSVLAWFFASACFALTGALIAWLGLWGPVLEAAQVKGWISLVQGWQTLIGALVAIAAAAIAWKNVGRTLSVTLMSREEDRLERELPGLREAATVLNDVVRGLQRLMKKKEDAHCYDLINRAIPRLPDTSIEHNVQRLFPGASDQLRQQICDVLRGLIATAQRLKKIHDRISETQRKAHSSLRHVFASIHGIQPADLSEEDIALENQLKQLETLRNEERAVLTGCISKLDGFVGDLRQRIDSIESRIPKLRRRIESFLTPR